MERRKALATAGAVTMTAVAGVIALGANFGIFGLADDTSKVGNFTPVDSATVITPTVDTRDVGVSESTTTTRSDGDHDDDGGREVGEVEDDD